MASSKGGKVRSSGNTIGIVLAGGKSRRMGGHDKTLMNLGGRPLLSHVAGRLAPQVDGMALNANGDARRMKRFRLNVVGDGEAEGHGPLAGVLAGLRLATEQQAARIVTVAGDTPFFPEDLVRSFLMAADLQSAPIVLAASRSPDGQLRMHPTFGLWDCRLADNLEASLKAGTRKILDWTGTHWSVPAEFRAAGFDPFFNINTPEDLARAKQILAESQA